MVTLTGIAERRTGGRAHTVCSPVTSATSVTSVTSATSATSVGEVRSCPGPSGSDTPMWIADAREPGLTCHGQSLVVPPGTYTWLLLLISGAVEGRHEVWLHHQDSVEPEWLHLDGPARTPTVVRIPVPRSEPLVAVRLPEADGLRVHAVTLLARPDAEAGAAAHPVDLTAHLNCVGIEPTARPGTGAFNIWHNTYPIEELPPPGSVTVVGAVPFRFPDADGTRPDNIRCRGQRIELPPTRADWLHLLAAAERRTEDVLTLHYADGSTRPQWLRVSDFWPETAPRFGELLAFRTSAMLYPNHVDSRMPPAIWRQRVPVAVPNGVVAVTLPDNPAIHVFALTVVDEEPKP